MAKVQEKASSEKVVFGSKKLGKAKKHFGPKEKKPKKSRGQGS
jgi:hypothetical protein